MRYRRDGVKESENVNVSKYAEQIACKCGTVLIFSFIETVTLNDDLRNLPDVITSACAERLVRRLQTVVKLCPERLSSHFAVSNGLDKCLPSFELIKFNNIPTRPPGNFGFRWCVIYVRAWKR